jgi:hypothetical protein
MSDPYRTAAAIEGQHPSQQDPCAICGAVEPVHETGCVWTHDRETCHKLRLVTLCPECLGKEDPVGDSIRKLGETSKELLAAKGVLLLTKDIVRRAARLLSALADEECSYSHLRRAGQSCGDANSEMRGRPSPGCYKCEARDLVARIAKET